MTAVLGWFLSCQSVIAAGTNEIRVVTRTHTNGAALITYEEFTRGGRTNLLRVTSAKDGVSDSRAHNFYHEGVYLGRHSQGGGYTIIHSAPGAPYALTFVLDASNQVRAATVTTTNYVILDSFTCTNGIFYPEASFRIEESNRKTRDFLPR